MDAGEETHAQPEPVEDGHDDADRGRKLEGVIEQVRGDALLGNVDDVRRMVTERLTQAGLPASEHDVDAVVTAVGDAPSGG
ncbi:hypothetical protein M3147_12315 [Agromyces mediolanus]|uniref:hypothetical protein n=1 Tax=Agromyces mediolanus TaxID=41986 RepID=UPI00203E8511|nr:hypothetical protein [Agromyces mediolanus]MCM3658036.1 hypothetical protein [Agromyces mediolanus]